MTNQPIRLTSQISIKLDGSEVQEEVMLNLASLVVDQHVHLPHTFLLRFNDPGMKPLDEGPFDLAKEVEIAAETEQGEKVTLIKGEITALEPDFQEGMIASFTARGFDMSHRLYRETRSKAYLNKKDSDLAAEIASRVNLTAEVSATEVIYEHIFQHNQSDLAFLQQRASRIGYECFVSAGKLFFRKPARGSASLTLTWGADLLSFQPRMTLAEQVEEVVVRGWDVEKQQPLVGRASRGSLYPQLGETKDGAEWARNFGTGRVIIVDAPVVTQGEADLLAAARLDEMSAMFVEAEGEAIRRPDIRAGLIVNIEAVSERFSGAYLVTHVTHTFSPAGLRSVFYMRGPRSGLLSEQFYNASQVDRLPGVVVGIVTNTDDPQNWGRVKVKFPWITEDAESDWCRVSGAGAGPEAGLFIMPAVGDEVLVAFIHGTFSQPCVLGSLWNGKMKIPPEAEGAASGEKPLVRTWHSRSGHWIAMYDDSKKKLELVSAKGQSLTLDDSAQSIQIKTEQVEITLKQGKVNIQSNSEVAIKSSGNLKLEANGNIDIKASGQVNVQGSMINLN